MSNFAANIIAAGLCLTAIGCRTPDPTVELLESELRWLEDNLYHLDDKLDQCYAQLESARRNNATLRQELAAAHGSATAGGEESDDKSDYDLESDDELFRFDEPVIELGEPADQNDGRPPAAPMPRGDGGPERSNRRPEIELPETSPRATDPAEESSKGSDPNRVTRILLNQRLTGGYDFDGRPGHDGIMVVVEPQNAQREYLAIPGELAIEVADPRKKGVAARVGKWQYDAVETAALLKTSLLGRGVHLELPWPGDPPQHDELRLTVVYETRAGEKLRAEKLIPVRTAGAEFAGSSARTVSWSWPQPDPKSTTIAAPVWTPNRPN